VRILFVSQEYPPETAHGGIATQTYLKAHGLAALGHEVHVLSHSTDGERHDARDGDVEVIRIPSSDARLAALTEPARWLAYSFEVAAEIARVHQRSPLDLVDFPEWAAEGFVHLLNRTEWSAIPATVQLHGPLVMFAHAIGWPAVDSEFYRVGTTMEGTCLRLADAVYSSSACSARWCAEHYGLRAEDIPVLHAGVDTRLFAPAPGARARRPTVVFVGRIARNKGVDLLVRAACRIARDLPGLHVRILGRGDERLAAELEREAASAGFSGLLELAGFVPRERLPAQLSPAHLLVAPSTYEGGPGFVYLEAMACGVPVVACAGSGASEVVKPGRNGLLVPPGDVDALAGAMRSLLADPARCQAMGEAARRDVEAEADARACARRLEELYLRVAARGAAGAPARRFAGAS
jgi:glycosyltransferase involved in cell wall biosynthesis